MNNTQSFILSIARYKLNLYQQRILLYMVNYGQSALAGIYLGSNLRQLPHPFTEVDIELPIRYVLPDGSQHYAEVRKALLDMMSIKITFYDPKKRTWYDTPLIFQSKYAERSGVIAFKVSSLFYDAMFNMSSGFNVYDFETALSLPTPYAVRLYCLVCGQTAPLEIPIDKIRAMFQLQDKYAQTRDLIKKVIAPSKAAMDAAGCNSFEFLPIKRGGKIVAVAFKPLGKPKELRQLQDMTAALREWLGQNNLELLIRHGGFTHRELSFHDDLWQALSNYPDATDLILTVINRARKKRKGKGYIIAAIRSELRQAT